MNITKSLLANLHRFAISPLCLVLSLCFCSLHHCFTDLHCSEHAKCVAKCRNYKFTTVTFFVSFLGASKMAILKQFQEKIYLLFLYQYCSKWRAPNLAQGSHSLVLSMYCHTRSTSKGLTVCD